MITQRCLSNLPRLTAQEKRPRKHALNVIDIANVDASDNYDDTLTPVGEATDRLLATVDTLADEDARTHIGRGVDRHSLRAASRAARMDLTRT